MPKNRFTDEQIAFALRQAEAGLSVGEICRKMGVAEATFHRWKKVHAGMGVSGSRRFEAGRGGELEAEAPVADLTLDKTMLQDALREEVVKPRLCREAVRHCQKGVFGLSGRRACRAMGFGRASDGYRSRRSRPWNCGCGSGNWPRRGCAMAYRRLHVLLQREGWQINHKRTSRLYSEEGLSIRTPSPAAGMPLQIGRAEAEGMNDVWDMDFLSDKLFDGRPFRILTIMDCQYREALAASARTKFRACQVVEELDRIARRKGKAAEHTDCQRP